MKKTTAIASFLFLATLTGIVQAAPQIATRAYVDSKTVQAGHDILVQNGRTVNATYESLQYDLNDYVSNLQDKPLPINGISQADGLIKVTTGAWGQVAPDEAAPASGGDVYDAIQNAIQNLGYTAGNGISITDGVITAIAHPDKNIKVYSDGIGIAMESYDAETDDDNNPGLFDGTMRVTSIKQNNTGNIKVGVDKWNEQWSLEAAPIRTAQIRQELDRKTNNVTAGRLISVTEVNTTEDELINNELGEKNYEIHSTLYPGNGIMFTTEGCVRGGTCIALRTTGNSALSFNEDGELSLSGLSYNSTETDARLENGTSRIASITQTDGIISVTTGDWVTSLDAENLEENPGVPATAKAIVAAIDQSVDPVEETANEALRVANEAAADATEALRVANNAIPKPDPNECGAPGKRCVLTYGKNSDGVLTYEWEVVTRAEGEQ